MSMFEGIDKALGKGCKLRSFKSGAGLRVTRIEDEFGILMGYGENPTIIESLINASKDYIDGKKEYVGQYLTGSPTPENVLDAHILRGGKLEVLQSKEEHNNVVLFICDGAYIPERIIEKSSFQGGIEEYLEKTLDESKYEGQEL